jgi:hypothetical protein
LKGEASQASYTSPEFAEEIRNEMKEICQTLILKIKIILKCGATPPVTMWSPTTPELFLNDQNVGF